MKKAETEKPQAKFSIGETVTVVSTGGEGEVVAVDEERDIYTVKQRGFTSSYTRVMLKRSPVQNDPAASKLLWRQGNLYTGYPYGVVVEEEFGSTELHGPFETETMAHNYGMELAMERRGVGFKEVHVVKIETPHVARVVTGSMVRTHFAVSSS